MSESIVTGQLIFRHNGAKTNDGRKLWIVCGIVALPDDAPFKSEFQYTVGSWHVDDDAMDLVVFAAGKDRSDVTIGNTPCGWLTEPIWRY